MGGRTERSCRDGGSRVDQQGVFFLSNAAGFRRAQAGAAADPLTVIFPFRRDTADAAGAPIHQAGGATKPSNTLPATVATTAIQGGVFQAVRTMEAESATRKSASEITALVHIG